MFRFPLPAVPGSATARRLSILASLVLTAVAGPAAQAQVAASAPTASNAPVVVAPADTAFQRLLRKNQYSLTAQGSQLSGPGWEKMRLNIEKSAFVLIGEDHGMAQIPPFAQAVAQVLKPKVYVAEIDQYQARDLSRLADQPALPTAFMRQHPNGLSFYSWQEEFELAQALRAQRAAILGIDQVSLTATGTFFGTLAGQVKNRQTRAYLLDRAAAYQAQDRAAMKIDTGRYSLMWQRSTALDSLRLLTRRESPAARQMVDDFAASAEIYRLNTVGDWRSHTTRVNLMKRNLLTSLRPYDQPGQPLPTMLFKFGASHLGRGRSIWGDVYDVGNLATNLADARDQQSLHIFIMGKQGTMVGGFHPDDFSKNSASYSRATEAMVLPFMAATPAGAAWQVFDVRPLRRAMLYKGIKVATPELEAVILGYDYVVIIPETTASRNF